MDSFLLPNQQYMPPIGFLVSPAQPGEAGDFGLPIAIEEGYRSIDISDLDLDLKNIGAVIQKCVEEDDELQRENLFITISIENHAYSQIPLDSRMQEILRDLQMEYVDLCLIEKPASWNIQPIDNNPEAPTRRRYPKDSNMHRIIEQLKDEIMVETVAAVGLNGFDKQMIMQIHDDYPELEPCVLKSDITPYFQNKETRQYCSQKRIQVLAYNGSTPRDCKTNDIPLVLEHPVVLKLAEKFERREMQVVYRWFIDNGMAVMTKTGSSRKLSMIQKIGDFRLEQLDLNAISEIDQQDYSHEFGISERIAQGDLQMPSVQLNNGFYIPMIGVSIWHKLIYMGNKCHHTHRISKIDAANERESVENALEAGVRHFDLGQVFGNHPMIGRIFRKYWDSGKVKRNTMFITSKVWNSCHSYDACIKAVDTTLADLQTDYLDMMLIHYPQGTQEGTRFMDAIDSKIDYTETWLALEECVKMGKVRSIGLCNFNLKQVKRVIEHAKVKPAVVQAELSVVFKKHLPLLDFCTQNGIAFEAAWPFGTEDETSTTISVDTSREVLAVAKPLGIKPRQLALLWLLHKQAIVLPRAFTFDEATVYLEALDYRLSPDVIAHLDDTVPESFPSWNDGIVQTSHPLWPGKDI